MRIQTLAFPPGPFVPPRRKEPVYFLAIELTSGAQTFCTGPSESIALKRWKRKRPALAESFASARVVTPENHATAEAAPIKRKPGSQR